MPQKEVFYFSLIGSSYMFCPIRLEYATREVELTDLYQNIRERYIL